MRHDDPQAGALGPTRHVSAARAPLFEEEPHKFRHAAESFGWDAERYDRARPRYPDALVRRVVAASPGPSILDVGCGTGIAARQFQAVGCRVLGVEPDVRMAALARRSGVETEVATFEAWESAGRQFDAVIAGQAWHWVDPIAGAAKAARVLRPAGRLAVFWNVFQFPADVGETFAAAYRRVVPDSPLGQRGIAGMDECSVMCTKANDGIARTDAFSDPEQWRFDWDRLYTRDEWLDQQPTIGGIGHFPPARIQELLTAIGAVIDAMGGSFTVHFTAMAVTAARNSMEELAATKTLAEQRTQPLC